MKFKKFQIVADGKKTIITGCFIDTLAAAVKLLAQGKTIAIKPIKPQITEP